MLNLIPLNLTIIGQYEGINVDQEVDLYTISCAT